MDHPMALFGAMSVTILLQVAIYAAFKGGFEFRKRLMWQNIEHYRRRRIRGIIRNVLCLSRQERRVRRLWKHRRSSDWWDNVVPTFNDSQWLEHFRVSKTTFEFICERVNPILAPNPQAVMPMHSLSVKKIVAIALYKLSHVAEYQVVGNLFGVHKSTVHMCLYGFCLAVTHMLGDEFIHMPDVEEASKIAKSFEEKCHIPQVIGAIDGSHIPITAPEDGHHDFVNRKFFCSYVLQAIVDNNLLFRDISCKMPGGCHDADVLRESGFYKNIDVKMPQGFKDIDGLNVPFMLLGDPAYPLQSWLMKNYSYDRNISPEMDSFNVYLNRGRIVVELAFGRLKGRWRVLLKKSDIDYAFMPTVIATCCILHNICEMSKDSFVNGWLDEVQEDEQENRFDGELNDNDNCPDAADIRDHLLLYLSRNFPLLTSIRGRYAQM